MHHTRDAQSLDLPPICDLTEGILQAFNGIADIVGPDTVFIAGCPGMLSGGNRREASVNGNGLNASRTEFDSDLLLHVFHLHVYFFNYTSYCLGMQEVFRQKMDICCVFFDDPSVKVDISCSLL